MAGSGHRAHLACNILLYGHPHAHPIGGGVNPGVGGFTEITVTKAFFLEEGKLSSVIGDITTSMGDGSFLAYSNNFIPRHPLAALG